MTGSPSSTSKPLEGKSTLSEKALALIRWHPVQWQAIVRSGGAVMRILTCPHRQVAFHGSFQSLLPSLVMSTSCRVSSAEATEEGERAGARFDFDRLSFCHFDGVG